MAALLIGLIFSLSFYCNLSIISWQHDLAIILLLISIFIYRKDQMAKYVIQSGIVLLFTELCWGIELGIFTKLFTIFLLISYLVFTLEKRSECSISKFSTLDILLILITLGGVTLALLSFPVSIWFFLTMFSLWFGTSFLLCRTIYPIILKWLSEVSWLTSWPKLFYHFLHGVCRNCRRNPPLEMNLFIVFSRL